MKQAYKRIKFNDRAEEALVNADKIIRQYQQAGLRLTLRQLYYQFVSRNLITNEEKSYKWLGKVISDGRLAGRLDWAAIEDRGRVPDVPSEWADVNSLIATALRAYRLPRWADQPAYAELWVEKQALAGVLEPLAHEHHVPLMVNKGYSSSSAMHESAQRFIDRAQGRPSHLFYLGDHDPSGEDMVRDVRERLELFGVEDLTVEKLALTWDQIEEFSPPPNPAKLSDSRAKAYIEKFGYESWEVDALPPDELARIITNAFEQIIDGELMEAAKEKETADKQALYAARNLLSSASAHIHDEAERFNFEAALDEFKTVIFAKVKENAGKEE